MALTTTETQGHKTLNCRAQSVGRRLVVGIPTAGRPGIVAESVRFLSRQSRLPDLVLLSVSDVAHSGRVDTEDLPFRVEVLLGPAGLTRQRNSILNELAADDVLMFLDDDFLMAADYLHEVERLFDEYPEIVLATGTVIADGILGPGLSHLQGEKILAEATSRSAELRLDPAYTGYACNAAIRAAPVIAQGIRFDEKLPLYSWLEDVDFSARFKPFGRFVRSTAMRGVHLGTKTGRTPGMSLGYSQIANPVYMLRKGTIAWPRARRLMIRNIGSNLLGTMRPRQRPWAYYRGRLIGNIKALADICLGRCDPERILSFNRTPPYRQVC